MFVVKKLTLLFLLFGLILNTLAQDDPTPKPDNNDEKESTESSSNNKKFKSSESSIFMYPGFQFKLPRFNRDPFRDLMNNDPFKEMEIMMDKMFNSRIEPLLSLRNFESGFDDMSINDDSFKYTVSMNGFKPEDVKIRVEGNDLIITGEHKEFNENGTLTTQRSFVRKYSLPMGYIKDSIKTNFNGKVLEITGQIEPRPTQSSVDIPIEYSEPSKTENEQQQNPDFEPIEPKKPLKTEEI